MPSSAAAPAAPPQSPLHPAAAEKLRSLLCALQAQAVHEPEAEEKFFAALSRACTENYTAFLKGVAQYRAAPFFRGIAFDDLPAPPALWARGTTRLLDFTERKKGARKKSSAGEGVFVIPSLINRAHILDLAPQQSFMRALAARGFRPFLLDWDAPGAGEKQFGMDDYMGLRLLPALRAACREAGGPVHVAGYCMGGLLATALAQLAPDCVKSLVCLASPWDFHAGDEGLTARVQATHTQLQALLELWGEMPVDILQSYFISLSPFALLDKYVRFASLPPDSADARAFVLLEDWVNDGVPLAGPMAHECLSHWYIENRPVRGTWQVMGRAILPQGLNLPSLHVIPQRDKIVPPPSAAALAHTMARATVLQPDYGHVSMMAHAAARDGLWPSILDWLASDKS